MKKEEFMVYQFMANEILNKCDIHANPSVNVEKIADVFKINILIVPYMRDLRITYLNYRDTSEPVPEYLNNYNKYDGKEFAFISEVYSPMTRISAVTAVLIMSFTLNKNSSETNEKISHPDEGYKIKKTLQEIYKSMKGIHEISINLLMPSNDLKAYFLVHGINAKRILEQQELLTEFCGHFVVSLPDATLRLKYYMNYGC